MSFCAKCGEPMEVRYQRRGFDTFWGCPVYVKEERCIYARGFLGILRGHTFSADRWVERAEWFGFTDTTIHLDWRGAGATGEGENP